MCYRKKKKLLVIEYGKMTKFPYFSMIAHDNGCGGEGLYVGMPKV